MNANRNQFWGTVVAQELARAGVRDVCVSPGSRSTPLTLAVHAEKGLRVTTHLDERSAAFFALGVGKATRRPAALICTSGTAAANYLPAVVEANHSRVPLLVLTADRPPELRDVGANQAIDQNQLFGRQVRWFIDVGLPQITPARIRHLRALVCRAIAKSLSSPSGPVHLNFPFQEPLEPTPVGGDVPEDWFGDDVEARDGRQGRPFVDVALHGLRPDDGALDAAASRLSHSKSSVIVVGPRFSDPRSVEAIGALAGKLGAPVLADPLSGLRYAGIPVVTTYDAWFADPARRKAFAPDLVLRIGASPTSKHTLTWLKETGAEQIVVTEDPNFGEETTRASQIVPGDAGIIAKELAARVKKGASNSLQPLAERWEAATHKLFDAELPKRAFEGAVLHTILAQMAAGSHVFVSSSLPVRDLDRFGPREARLQVHANRGASGIDGITSTALGIAHAQGQKVTLVVGDLAFLHDLSGLVAARRLRIPIDIIVLDNDGGGIFEFLPVAKHEPPFTELFVTPHGLDLASIGKALGFDTQQFQADAAERAAAVLSKPSTSSRLFVIKTDRKANVKHRRELEKALDQALAHTTETARAR